jgi:hypothetical protein
MILYCDDHCVFPLQYVFTSTTILPSRTDALELKIEIFFKPRIAWQQISLLQIIVLMGNALYGLI